MFGPPGHAYVYLVYGMYHCLNVVTEPRGHAAALLVRSIEPLEGIDLMRHAREAAAREAAARQRVAVLPAARLGSGPGLVCAAFSIGRAEDGADLCDPAAPLHLEPAPVGEPALEPSFGPRIGIASVPEPWRTMPWRFWVTGNRSVSGGRATR